MKINHASNAVLLQPEGVGKRVIKQVKAVASQAKNFEEGSLETVRKQ